MPGPSTRERRQLRRIIHRIPASFTGEHVQGRGHVKNISQEGIFLRVDELPEPGTRVRVVIEPENAPKLEVEGTVIWTTAQLPPDASAKPGFGMKLDEITDEFYELFESVLLR